MDDMTRLWNNWQQATEAARVASPEHKQAAWRCANFWRVRWLHAAIDAQARQEREIGRAEQMERGMDNAGH